MIRFSKALSSVDEQDLQRVITDQILEGKTIDYKQHLPGRQDKEKKEFLSDVSSFANASGGHLFFGIEEEAGRPIAITGVQILDIDALKLDWENMLRTAIEPRLPRATIQPIPLLSKPGYWVIIVEVQKSWLTPHRVTHQDHGHFYSRNSAGKYRLDVSELRTAFDMSNTATERIRSFRADRLAQIVSGETPEPLAKQSPTFVFHLIPLRSFDPAVRFDLLSLTRDAQWSSKIAYLTFEQADEFFLPSTQGRLNFDGLLRYQAQGEEYIQIFRNGIIEAASTLIGKYTREKHLVIGSRFERGYLQLLKRGLELQQWLKVDLPIFVMVSVLNVTGCHITDTADSVGLYRTPIDRSDLIVPEAVVDTFTPNYHQIMKPIFDAIWNASGHLGSPHYNGPDGQPSIIVF